MVEEKAVEAGQFTQPAANEGSLANTGYYQPYQLADLEKQGRLYLIADGLGGAASQVASHYAIKKILYSFYSTDTPAEPQERLLEVIQQVNRDIFERNNQQPERRPMATALTAALIHQNKLIVARVGDGQVYVVWDQDIERLTQEIGSGELQIAEPEKEAAVKLLPAKVEPPPAPIAPPPRPILPRERLAKGVGLDKTVKIDVFARRLFAGDVVIMCSGGLNGYITDKEIARAVTRHPADQALKRLVALAKERGRYEHVALSLTRILSNSVIVHPPDPMPLPEAPKWSDWTAAPKPSNHLDTHPTQPSSPTSTQPMEQPETKQRQRTPSEGLPTINWRGKPRYSEWRWYTYAALTLALILLCGVPALAWYYLDPSHLLTSVFLDDEVTPTPEAVAETPAEEVAATSPQTGTVTATAASSPVAATTTVSPTREATAIAANNSVAAASGSQFVSPISTPTSVTVASSTLVIETPTPSPTPAPTIQVPAGCESKARFGGDITVPDGTQFAAGEAFQKVWRVQNAGSCPWGPGYTVRMIGGDMMGPNREAPVVSVVEPNTNGEISISLVAPETPGTYRGDWQLFDLSGQAFGPEMYLEIEVVPPDPAQVDESQVTVLYDFIENADEATWISERVSYVVRETGINETLELPAAEGMVATGVAQLRGNAVSDRPVLLTYPHQELGLIEGRYTVQAPLQPTDTLVATLGFPKLSILSDDGVIFEVGFTPAGGEERLLLSRPVLYQESPVNEVVPLTNVEPGQQGTFTLRVRGGESLSQDWALWLDLRLIRP
jgi:serine/threonine protein phosphatase PrpC